MSKKLELPVSKKVEKKVLEELVGQPFTVSDFPDSWGRKAIITTLHRLLEKGLIRKWKRGFYYVPQESEMYGEVSPSSRAILEKLESENKDLVPTGGYLFNLLGLSTQVPTVYSFLHNKSKNSTEIAGLKIEFKKAKVPIYSNTKKFYKYLEVADNIELIPDKNVKVCIDWFRNELSSLTERELSTIIRMSYFYPSKTRALLCAIIDEFGFLEIDAGLEKMELKKTSRYYVGRIADHLKKSEKWRLFKSKPSKKKLL